jgi:hypothetical protein
MKPVKAVVLSFTQGGLDSVGSPHAIPEFRYVQQMTGSLPIR